jgi:hypothetical protein
MKHTHQDAVNLAIKFLADAQTGDDSASQRLADAANISLAKAGVLITFVPIAFARVWLAGSPLKFSPTYLRLNQAGEPLKREYFEANPVFAEACWQARQLIESGYSHCKFLAIASRSAEFRAINSALHDGAQFENLEPAEPVITCDDDLSFAD